jgi:prolipoprotein diacylglyceryl transferase
MTTTVLAYFPSPPRGVWHLGPVPIRAYALFIIIGIVVALLIGDRRWEARGGERGVIYDIALWAVPFGLIGGRLYHLATDWRTYFGEGGAGLGAALRIWDGGLGIWGAVALGGVGAWIGCRRRGIPLPAFGDAIAPGIALAQAIGRLGNYFNQELFGRETTMPWGLEIFYRRDPSGYVDWHSLDGVSTGHLAMVVQPTFLYELLWNIAVFVALIYLDRRFTIGHGRLFALYVAGYCVGRFCIELLRDDTATHIAGIRINSFTSTFVFIGAVVYLMLAPKGREDPAALGGAAAEEPVPEPATEVAAVSTPSRAAAVPTSDAAGAETEEAEAVEVEAPEAEEPEAETERRLSRWRSASSQWLRRLSWRSPQADEAEAAVASGEAAEREEAEELETAAVATPDTEAGEPESEAVEVEAPEAEEPEAKTERRLSRWRSASSQWLRRLSWRSPQADEAEAAVASGEAAEREEAEELETAAVATPDTEAGESESEAVEAEVAEMPEEPKAEAAREEPETAPEEAEATPQEPEAVEPEAVKPEAVERESAEPKTPEPEANEPDTEAVAVEAEASAADAGEQLAEGEKDGTADTEAEPPEAEAPEAEAAAQDAEPVVSTATRWRSRLSRLNPRARRQ